MLSICGNSKTVEKSFQVKLVENAKSVQRVATLKNLKFKMYFDLINVSQSSSNRHISIATVQRRLCESGLYGQIAAKKPLKKETNKKKRLAWAKKHE